MFLRPVVLFGIWSTVLGAVCGTTKAGQDAVPPRLSTWDASRVPKDLCASDWSSIRAAYEANCHVVFAVDGGLVARNPGQRWTTRFDGRGFETSPDAGAWTWGLDLVSLGRDELLAPLFNRSGQAPEVAATGQRVEYEWKKN